jgi:AGZA family xanthine/uracil permease-like MFS transporter
MAGNIFEKWFKLQEKGTDIRTEIIAGITTFMTMSYIIFVNPDILSKAGMDHGAVVTATCLAAAVATMLVGMFANAPIAMAPGMGLNAFFAYSLVLAGKMNWQTALGVVFISGLLFLLLTVIGLRKKLIEAIPRELIAAISVGIGLFITFIGLVNLGLIGANPATLVTANPLNPTILIGLFGLILMLGLEYRKVPGSLLVGIIAATLLAALLGKVEKPAAIISGLPNISAVAFKLDIISALKWSCAAAVFSLMFTDMFDSLGSLSACGNRAGMSDEKGHIKGISRLLAIDAVATMIGAVLGTSTTTAYIESASGIEQGGRSGISAIVCGLLFLPAILFLPLIGCVPSYAIAPALIMVGMFMMREITHIDFNDIVLGFSAFTIIVMIPLSYSISTGLAFGFSVFVLLKLLTNQAGEVKLAMWIIAVLSALFLAQNGLSELVSHLKSVQ